jgi:hypothetical protein
MGDESPHDLHQNRCIQRRNVATKKKKKKKNKTKQLVTVLVAMVLENNTLKQWQSQNFSLGGSILKNKF